MVLRLAGIAQDAHVGFSSLRVILNDDSELTLPLMCVAVYFNLRCILQSSLARPDRQRKTARATRLPSARTLQGISIGLIPGGRSGAPYLAKSDIRGGHKRPA